MARTEQPSRHPWHFYRAGGVDQVRLDRGADILHLDELDQKLWVALSCPTQGIDIDTRMLQLLDGDGDAHIRPPEIIATVRWLRAVLQNGDSLIAGTDGVALAALRTDTPEGQALLTAARHVLKSIGKSEAVVTIADCEAAAAALAKAKCNGDGVVVPSQIDDAFARGVAADVVACCGGVRDRSGDTGFDEAGVERFFAAAAAFDAWNQQAESDAAQVLPFGDGTAAAHAAFRAVRAKIDDYFGRCRLAAFDPRALAAVNREQDAYVAAVVRELTISVDEVRDFPLAQVAADKPLPLAKGINPAWADALATFRAACCDGRDTLDEAGWAQLKAKFAPYEAWLASETGAEVHALGVARVRAILASDARAQLMQAIAADRAVAAEVMDMTAVEKLARLHKSFIKLLNNYVSFTDFYARRDAVFQAGTLYLDGRALDLCFHVNNPGRHAALAGMAKTYLVYVDCTRPGASPMQIACAFTAGDSDNIFVGRNGIFYDRRGQDWDATIAKIVDNPISVRQAFWSPYKKLIRWIEESVAKRAAEADTASTAALQDAAAKTGEAAATGKAAVAPPKKMDIGVLAAITVAISGVTAIVGTVLARFFDLGYLMPLGFLGVILLISGPSMLIAWMKLRQRNLGPILDANGWAVNTLTRINIPLGSTLTEMPRLPPGSTRSLVDPYAPKRSIWPRVLLVLLVLAGVAYGLYRANLLHKWLPKYFPAHHTEFDLGADRTSVAPGGSVEFVVRSAASVLKVTNATDTNAPVELPDLPVAGGRATLAVPPDAKPGRWVVSDAVGGTRVVLTITAPAAAK